VSSGWFAQQFPTQFFNYFAPKKLPDCRETMMMTMIVMIRPLLLFLPELFVVER